MPAFLLAVVAASSTPAKEPPPAKTVTLVGEIVCAGCFMREGQKGPEHKECATACAAAGQDLALYDEANDTLYLIVSERGVNQSISLSAQEILEVHEAEAVGVVAKRRGRLLSYVGERVRVTGMVIERDGAKGIMLRSIALEKTVPSLPTK